MCPFRFLTLKMYMVEVNRFLVHLSPEYSGHFIEEITQSFSPLLDLFEDQCHISYLIGRLFTHALLVFLVTSQLQGPVGALPFHGEYAKSVK